MQRFLVAFYILIICFNITETRAMSLAVESLLVEGKGDDSISAKINAIEKGQVEAFITVIERIVPGEEINNILPADHGIIFDMVKHLEIKNEKLSSTEYQAEINIIFAKELIAKYLEKFDIKLPKEQVQPSLVIPVYHRGNKTFLWEAVNKWKTAWQKALSPSEQEQFIIPEGDLEDVTTINLQSIDNLSSIDLKALLKKYQSAYVIFAKASYYFDKESNKPAVSISIKYLNHPEFKEFRYINNIDQNLSLQQLLEQAVRKFVLSRSKASIKEAIIIDLPVTDINAKVKIKDLRSWLGFKQKLSTLQGVENLKIKEISENQAIIEISYQGAQQDIIKEIKALGALVSKEADLIIIDIQSNSNSEG